jgi:arylsulfatase
MYKELTAVKYICSRFTQTSLPPVRGQYSIGGVAALVLLIVAGCSQISRPDVILITVDTLRPDRLGSYGCLAARTPNIDSLAARGIRFTQATTPFPRTTPALASLFTGLWPQHHGSREIFRPFEGGVTMAEVLRDRGYATFGVTANPAAGRKLHFDRGFQHFAGKQDLGSEIAEGVTDRALAYARAPSRSEPLFLWVHYMDPHFPYLPPSTFADQPEAAACRRLMDEVAGKRLRIAHVEGDLNGVSSRALDDCRALYDAEIAYVDREIGRLLEGLGQLAPPDSAIIIFTSDHGENFGEAGLHFGHGSNVHDASLRVPLIIAGPGVLKGVVDEQVFRLEDLLPTLLSLLRVSDSQLPITDGRDLSARILDRPVAAYPEEPVALAESGSALNVPYFNQLFCGRVGDRSCVNGPEFSLCGYAGGEPSLYHTTLDPHLTIDVSDEFPRERQHLLAASRHWAPEEARERTARTARLKLVEYPRLGGGYRRALYDLRADSLEMEVDVSGAHPAALRRLVAALDAWAATISPPSMPAARDETVLQSLRSLGYIE